MATLGIEFTDRRPVTGWEAIGRSGHCQPDYVADARAAADQAWQEVHDITEGAAGNLALAMLRAQELEAEYGRTWQRWQDQKAAEVIEIELEGLHMTMLELAGAMS